MRHSAEIELDQVANGQELVAVDFDLEEFKAWCLANGKKRVAASRSEFTVNKLRETH